MYKSSHTQVLRAQVTSQLVSELLECGVGVSDAGFHDCRDRLVPGKAATHDALDALVEDLLGRRRRVEGEAGHACRARAASGSTRFCRRLSSFLDGLFVSLGFVRGDGSSVTVWSERRLSWARNRALGHIFLPLVVSDCRYPPVLWVQCR